MFASISLLFVVIASVLATFEGVDPNSLKCDPQGLITLHLPHYTDCDKFYMCSHGEEVEFSCAPGTIFDFSIQVCNYPWATKCWLRTKDIDEEGSGEEDLTITDSIEYAHKPVGESLMSSDFKCHNIDVASRRVAFKGDCQRYWSCTAGTPHAYYCTEGLFFNEEKQDCDFEGNVKCIDDRVDELRTEFIEYK